MKRILLSSVLIIGVGCGGGETASTGGGASAAAGGGEATGPMGAGVVAVTVDFTGTPPANPTIDMSEEPFCAAKYQGAPRDPQVLVQNGKLENVFVYVKSGLPAGAKYTPASTPVVLDQQGCLYHPRVFGVMVGQPIEILNNDSLLHNIKAVPHDNRPFNISQPTAGMHTNRTFATPEIMVPLECNVHGWMHASVGVVSHPFFATSGADGMATISKLPAGTYELEAWHEKFGTQTQTVTVPESGTVQVQFTFSAPAS